MASLDGYWSLVILVNFNNVNINNVFKNLYCNCSVFASLHAGLVNSRLLDLLKFRLLHGTCKDRLYKLLCWSLL